MKNVIYLVIFVASISALAQDKNPWEYKKYAEVVNPQGQALFTLEYGIKKKGYNGSVIWKVTNNTTDAMYSVKIGKRTYYLKDGKTKTVSLESIGKIAGGQTKAMAYSDPINTSEGKGWDSVTDNVPIKIEFTSWIMKFSSVSNGEEESWEKYGKLKLSK